MPVVVVGTTALVVFGAGLEMSLGIVVGKKEVGWMGRFPDYS